MKLKPTPRDRSSANAEGADTVAALPRGDLLLPYQQRAVGRLFAGVSLLVIEKSRRIGLTWGLAAYAVLRAGAPASAGGMNAWYMGYDLEMAREFIDTCVMWARAFNIAAEAADEELLEDGGKEKVQAFRIRFACGFKVVALPSVPRALRGKQGLVIVDEAAFHGELAEVIKSALALLMWGGQVVIVSTHYGVANPFNLLLDDVRAGRRKGEVLTITFDQAIADGLYERIALGASIKSRAILAKAEWIADIRDTYGVDAEEELDCIPKAGAGSFLDPGKLAACEHPDAGRPELYAGGLWYLGRDVARRRDLSAIHGFELIGDVLWMRDRWVERAATFLAQDVEMDRLIAARRFVRGKIDQTGMGEKVVEDAVRRHGSRIEGELLTGPTRLDLALALQARVDNCTLRIPPLPELRADYRAIKKKGGVAGSVQIVNADDEVHADEFWASALACSAAETAHQPFAYRGVPRGGPPAGRDADTRLARAGAGRFGAQRGML